MSVLLNPYRWRGIVGVRFSEANFSADNNGVANFGFRIRFPASALAGSWASCAVTFQASATQALSLTGAYIGHRASSGDAYDANNLNQLLFSGSGTLALSANASQKSDTLAFSYDGVRDLIITFGVLNDGTKDGIRESSSTVAIRHSKSGGSGEAGTADVTGYSTASSSNFSVKEIEAMSV